MNGATIPGGSAGSLAVDAPVLGASWGLLFWDATTKAVAPNPNATITMKEPKIDGLHHLEVGLGLSSSDPKSVSGST